MSYNVINQYQTFRDSTGEVRANGKITFYDNLTTDLASIWSDEALTVSQSNPYDLDAYGRITGDVKYKGLLTLKIQNADLSDTRTDDNVASLEPTVDVIELDYATDIAADTGTPNRYVVTWYDNNNIIGSGATWTSTGTTTAGNAGLGVHTDGYLYNANGNQYEIDGLYSPAKAFGAVGDGVADDTVAIQSAIQTNRTVYFHIGTYLISSTLGGASSGTGYINFQGEFYRDCKIQADTGFSGYMIQADSSYVIRDMTINGLADTDGIYGLGSNTAGAAGGIVTLDKVSFYYFDENIRFGEEYEHPIGLNYTDVYCQYFVNAGINLGGLSGAASSGESNFEFSRVAVTNQAQTRTAYAESVADDTPDATHDRVTWSASAPTYGFVVMRSADDATGWHVPPNWNTLVGFTANTFDAEKVALETWFYKVVRQTVGINVRRARALSGGSVQSEKCGIGQLYSEMRGVSLDSIYYEYRDEATPSPALCAIAADNVAGMTIDSGTVDVCSYGVIASSNSTVSYKNVRHVSVEHAPIGKFNAATLTNVEYSGLTGVAGAYVYAPSDSAYDYNDKSLTFDVNEYVDDLSHVAKVKRSLSFRGTEKSSWAYDNTNGTVLDGINSLDVTPFSKALISPTHTSGDLKTTLTDGVATAFLTFTVISNSVLSYSFMVNIDVYDGSSVHKQSEGGLLIVNATSSSGTVAAGVATTVAQALQAGTLTTTFSASVAGSVVTVKANANTDISSPTLKISVSPISLVAQSPPTDLTQS